MELDLVFSRNTNGMLNGDAQRSKGTIQPGCRPMFISIAMIFTGGIDKTIQNQDHLKLGRGVDLDYRCL